MSWWCLLHLQLEVPSLRYPGSVWAVPTTDRLYTTLEATQGQMNGFFSQPPFICYLLEVASVGD
jgi:hypothetical protein